MKYILLFIFMAVHFSVHSQFGYMGKKLTVQYGISIYTCPVISVDRNSQGTTPGVLLFKSSNAVRRVLVAQHLDLGFTVSRQWELTAMASIRPINYAAYRDYNSSYNYTPQFTEIPVLETVLDLCVRKYIRGASAPVGGYFYFGLGKSSAKTSIEQDSIRFQNYNSNQPDRVLPTYNSTWSAIRLIYGMGIKKTINNKYFYQIEGTLATPISDSNNNYASGSTPIEQSIVYMNETIRPQFLSYQNFYAKFGVGAFIGKSSRLPKKS